MIRVRTSRRGPLVVDVSEEGMELLDANGKPIDLQGRSKVLLCRCGASRNTPLCDGSHNRIGFSPEGER